mgnify:CR=1 FL=1
MGVIANAVLDNGGKVHGVITRQLYERQTALDRVKDLKIVSNMDVRKDLMMDLADGLVALPGGIGTLEEISEAFSWMSLGDNAKPTALYNVNGFMTPCVICCDACTTLAFWNSHTWTRSISPFI